MKLHRASKGEIAETPGNPFKSYPETPWKPSRLMIQNVVLFACMPLPDMLLQASEAPLRSCCRCFSGVGTLRTYIKLTSAYPHGGGLAQRRLSMYVVTICPRANLTLLHSPLSSVVRAVHQCNVRPTHHPPRTPHGSPKPSGPQRGSGADLRSYFPQRRRRARPCR